MRTVTRETFVERRQSSVRWGAIIAGTLVAISVWVVLQMIGLGAGMAAIDTDDPASLRGAGIGTGIWSIIAPLLALFAGGFVATRAGGVIDRGAATIHGGVLWALSMILGMLLMTWAVSAVVGTMVRTGGQVVSAAGGAAGDVDASAVMSSLGVSADDLVAPINERLRAQGKPAISPEGLEAALQGTLRRAIREGHLDRDMVVAALARNTTLSREDAEDVASQLEARFGELGAGVRTFGEQAETAALTAADRAGKALLGTGVALLLGLGAAIGGAILGARRREHAIRERDVAVTPVVPPPTDTGV